MVADDDDYMSRMGGMNGGMGGDRGFGGIDFSKLGGAGMGGGPSGDEEEEDDEAEEDDDEEMPELEEDDTKEGAAPKAGSSKIEEVE